MPDPIRKVDYQGSILNPLATGNVSGATPAALAMPKPGSDKRIDPNRAVDPGTTMITNGGVDPVVQSMVRNHEGAPRTAQLVANRLAALYGPFSAGNSAQNRAAIIKNLTWIAGTGIRYDYARANGTTPARSRRTTRCRAPAASAATRIRPPPPFCHR